MVQLLIDILETCLHTYMTAPRSIKFDHPQILRFRDQRSEVLGVKIYHGAVSIETILFFLTLRIFWFLLFLLLPRAFTCMVTQTYNTVSIHMH